MTMETPKKPRGFAAMTPERHRAIASMGGSSVPVEKRSFSQDRALAASAGKKGGSNVNPGNRPFSRDHDLARDAGAKGGRAKAMEAVE